MAREEIVVNIDNDGNIEAKAHGFKGKTCEEAMEFIRRLGAVTEHRRTSDFYQRQEQNHEQRGRR